MDRLNSHVLIVDDDTSLCDILVNTLSYVGYKTSVAKSGKKALEIIEHQNIDIMLLDFRLPDMNGLDILKTALKYRPWLPVIMISGQGSIQVAVNATKIGAYDFLEKPIDAERVLITLKNALEISKLHHEKMSLIDREKQRYLMIGQSQKMLYLEELISKAAASNSKVLIQGENGTGKELVARSIHYSSNRAANSFVAVNCAAIPESLIESELFGHKKGSFTGAYADKKGRFQLADNGTLLLDEIGDMSILTQAKLLRTLEENIIEMVGGSDPISIDVRVIAATNKDLDMAVRENDFRKDLFFRLNVINIQVPSLRERKEDIPILTEYYIQYFCNELNIPNKSISTRAMNRLIEYHWPGNVRELKNVIEKTVVLLEGDHIEMQDIASVLSPSSRYTQENKKTLNFKDAKHAFEKEYILEKLYENNFNITRAAECMDLPRTYLHKKIKTLNIQA